MRERRKSWGAPIAVVVILLLLPAGYIGAYLAMVDYFDPLSLLGTDVEGSVCALAGESSARDKLAKGSSSSPSTLRDSTPMAR